MMNTKLTRRSICALVLAGWGALASALSIGPITGTTVVGRPLDLIAPIQFDEAGPGNGSGCVTAQVMYGDKAVVRTRVDVDVDAARQLAYARISSAIPVDEPFVTVVLNAGCSRPYSKRYVLLAEAPLQAPMVLAAASALRAAAPVQIGAVAPAATAQLRSVPPVASLRVAGAAARAERPGPVRRVAAVPLEPTPRSGGRLQLAVWDPNSEQLPWLRTSTELKSSPTADAARRAAATSLWRALNAQPQDLLRTAERLRGLEGEVSSLRSLSARHRAEIASARESLQGAQTQRHTSLLLVTLLALLAGGSGAFLWHRSRRPAEAPAADSWYAPIEPWSDVKVVEEERKPAAAGVDHPVAVPPPVVAPPPVVKAAADPAPVPRKPVAAAPVLAPFQFTPPEAAPVALAHDPDRPGLKVDALQGAQQQAEFFASLGQVDEAVAVLTAYLEESRERPVLAYLELFRIYHGTGMRVEYEELQSKFRQGFGMDVASFGEYKDEPRELDLYLLPVTRIASAWPSGRSQEIIEELLFKRPATPRDLLSLEAYRELIWLYSLGLEVLNHTGTPAGLQLLGDRGMPNDHFILPWAVEQHQGPTELSLDRLDAIDVAPDLSAFAVDIDLTAMRGDGHPAVDAIQQHQSGPKPAPAPTAAPTPDFDAFDAAMESESRRHR